MSERVCKNCWSWYEPKYSAQAGKCVIGVYDKPYANTEACDEFDDRYPDEEN